MASTKYAIKLSVGKNKYGIITNTQSEAAQYINRIVDALKKQGVLQSLKSRGDDVYILTTSSRKTIITVHGSSNATYRVRYFINDNYQRTFTSDNVDRLIDLVHSRLSIDKGETSPKEDIIGIWTQKDTDIEERYELSVNVDEEELRYLDILASISTDTNPFIKPDLAEYCKGSKLRRVKTSYSHCISCFLWTSALGPLGIIIATILTATYTSKVMKFYGENYLVARHISNTAFWRVIGAIAGCLSAMVISLTKLTVREATATTQRTVYFINPFAIVALLVMIFVGMIMTNIAKSHDETIG